jgi:hypothetical protein
MPVKFRPVLLACVTAFFLAYACSTKNDPPVPEHGAKSTSTSSTSTTSAPVSYFITVAGVKENATGFCQDTPGYQGMVGSDTGQNVIAVIFDSLITITNKEYNIGLQPSGDDVSLAYIPYNSSDPYIAVGGKVTVTNVTNKRTVTFSNIMTINGSADIKTVSGYFGCP